MMVMGDSDFIVMAFPVRNNHHDWSEATLTLLSCFNGPGAVNWNLV